MIRLSLLAAALLALTACEALPRNDSADEQRTYRTGSNIPQRDRAAPIEQRSIDQSQVPRNVSPASRSGG